MRVTPIRNPARDEGIVAVHPDMTFPTVEGAWTSRLNLFTGRSLSDRALTSEQIHRGRRLAALGQEISRGVVRGFEIASEPATGDATEWLLHIDEGSGIAATGEDVRILQSLRLTALDIPVYAPATIIAGTEDGDAAGGGDAEGSLLRRHLGPSLRDLIADPDVDTDALPRAAVLVLQPIAAEMVGEVDPEDPCERDPQDDAFDDWQLADGCRVVLYFWPDEWLSLPPRDAAWRNTIADTVFEREALLSPMDVMPWEELGVPIGVVGFNDDFSLDFVDRYSVVRAGGRPNRRVLLLSNAGNRFLWQARLEQFADQLAGLSVDENTDTDTSAFRFLPPFGILPTRFLTSTLTNNQRTFSTTFFPGFYDVDVVPIPVEQLDAVVEASAPLSRIDLAAALTERIRLYVPVPQTFYEPRLLEIETIHPEFEQQLNGFLEDRAEALQRRQDVRDKTGVLTAGITGVAVDFPDPDPDALEQEDVATDPLDPPEEAYGTDVIDVSGTPTLVAQDLEALRQELVSDFPLSQTEVDEIDQVGLDAFIKDLDLRVDGADDVVDFRFVRVQANVHQVRQMLLGQTKASRLATSSVLASIAKGSSARASRQQIEEYFGFARGQAVPPDQTTPTTTPSPSLNLLTALAPTDLHTTINTRNDVTSGTSFAFQPGTPLGAPSAGTFQPLPGTGVGFGTVFGGGGKQIGGIVKGESQKGSSSLFKAQFSKADISIGDVIGQSAIVGKADQFRTLTVAQRLEDSPAKEAWEFAISTKYEAVKALSALDIDIDNIQIVGMDGENPTDPAPTFVEVETSTTLAIEDILDEEPPEDGDEAAFLGSAVAVLDEAVLVLRRVEGRIQGYRKALSRCGDVLATIAAHLASANQRLRVIDGVVAEARHDVAVARALMVEEQDRLDRINERRDEILAKHVPFVAFARPRVRLTEADEALPMRPLDPGLVESPVPQCLRRAVDPPKEMRAMIDVLRDAPARWFPKVNQLLFGLDRLDVVNRTVRTAVARAEFRTATFAQEQFELAAGPFLPAVANVLQARRQVAFSHRTLVKSIDPSVLVATSLTEARKKAEEIVTLGDLIDGDHGRASTARRAAAELENIGNVATCLYVAFGEVNPRFRLLWAERLSEHDEPVNLRNLSSLPRFGELEFEDRFELQSLVDWLYQRINPKESDPAELMSDLVRVCLLLASHAPVNRIVAGQVRTAATAEIGKRVELVADTTKVRVGMHVLVYAGSNPVARAVVDDLSESHATASILNISQPNVLLEQGAKVQFAEPFGFATNPMTAQFTSSVLG